MTVKPIVVFVSGDVRNCYDLVTEFHISSLELLATISFPIVLVLNICEKTEETFLFFVRRLYNMFILYNNGDTHIH